MTIDPETARKGFLQSEIDPLSLLYGCVMLLVCKDVVSSLRDLVKKKRKNCLG